MWEVLSNPRSLKTVAKRHSGPAGGSHAQKGWWGGHADQKKTKSNERLIILKMKLQAGVDSRSQMYYSYGGLGYVCNPEYVTIPQLLIS